MRIYQLKYDSILSLHQLPIEEILEAGSVWIHITTTLQSHRNVEKILKEVRLLFPDAIITGMRTEGSVCNEQYDLQETLITLVTFRDCHIKQYRLNPDDPNHPHLKKISEDFRRHKKGVALFFVDPIHVDAEDILRPFYRSFPDFLPIAHLASDGERDYDSYVIAKDQVISGGVTLLMIASQSLRYDITLHDSLRSFGLPFHITRSKNRRLYDIDGIRATDFLEKNLGKTYVDQYPHSGWRITIATTDGEHKTARTPLKALSDRSILFAARIVEGSVGQFVYTDDSLPERFVYPAPMTESSKAKPLYLYLSDVVHRRYRRAKMAKELEILSKKGHVCGSYGFGIVTLIDQKIVAFNQSTAILLLMETSEADHADILAATATLAPPNKEVDLLQTVMGHYLQKEFSSIEILHQIAQLWLQEEGATLVYDANLRLVELSEEAEKEWSILPRIDFSDDLTKLDHWIVQTLQKALQGHISTMYGPFLNSKSGQTIQLRLMVMPLQIGSRVIGGVATFELG